ncbi:hypothetical protein P4S55_05730 [Shewanella sp. PP-Sp27a-2]
MELGYFGRAIFIRHLILSKNMAAFFLGITGAIFANSTGAGGGGGVIFIPVFSSLSFSESQSVATSFMIQCFGMTAGAISWSLHYKKRHREDAAYGLVL